ncbi:MAG: hypothetical protein J2P54_18370 [Bradyrhizobiaceae bacterium]|nr:hypothetical protein [Bradyrhizobiaceae bacterium]
MIDPKSDEVPLTTDQARIVARVRWLMIMSGIATALGIAVVIGVIGYRVFNTDGSTKRPEVTVRLPKGSRILQTAVSGGRVAVTVDNSGTTEIHMFDLNTLQPTGRLVFGHEP